MSKTEFSLTACNVSNALFAARQKRVHVPFSISITRTDDPRLEPAGTLINVSDAFCKRTPRQRLSSQAKTFSRSEKTIGVIREQDPCHRVIAIPHEYASDRKDP